MITVNESGEDLIKGEDTITLVDEMKSPLQFDTDSIVVKDKNGNLITGISPKIETTDTGQKMSLTIPDNKKLTITYEATLNAAPDTDITVNNKAYWFGHSTTVAMIENTTVRYHVEAFAGTTTSPAVKVKKVDKERRTYYEYFTDKKWKDISQYHLAFDSSKFEQDKIIQMIKMAL